MDIVTALANATSAIFKYLDTNASKKYLDELTKTQLAYQEERSKGQDRDDGYVQYLHEKLAILANAAASELARIKK